MYGKYDKNTRERKEKTPKKKMFGLKEYPVAYCLISRLQKHMHKPITNN